MNIGQLLRPLRQSIANMVARALVTSVDDSPQVQQLQLELTGETRGDVERIQNYGFSSCPSVDAEAVVVFVGGDRSHGLVVACDDRRYRVLSLQDGEVVVYDKTGSKVFLKANGDIEMTPSSGTVKVTGNIVVSGNATVDGNVGVGGNATASGTITGDLDVVGGGKSLKTHVHAAGALLDSLGHPVTGSTATPT